MQFHPWFGGSGPSCIVPSGTPPAVSTGDRIRSRLIGIPETWAFTRQLASQLGPNDVVYCLDTDLGIPLASALRGKKNRPKVAVYVHNLIRPRGKLATKLLKTAESVDLFFSCCSSQLTFIQDWLKVPEDRTMLLLQHVDEKFYSPGPPTPGKKRPLVVSVGLEKRDYVTLAEATKDLDVDVCVDAWSAHARRNSKTFPAQLPANMSLRTSKPTELVQLYRDADVVVVSLLPNNYAGITTLVEGLACARPVVASRTVGLEAYLTPPDGISTVEPSNPAAMRAAIVRLLEHPEEAQTQAHQGYESVARRYDFDRYIETVASRLEAL